MWNPDRWHDLEIGLNLHVHVSLFADLFLQLRSAWKL
jgi:hypothetical protein